MNRVINLSLSWFNINPGYNNQTIEYSSDDGSNFKELKSAPGIWNYTRINEYIQYETKIEKSDNTVEYPIRLEFNDSTLKTLITLKTNYQVDLRVSYFNDLIGFNKKILKLWHIYTESVSRY